MPEMSNSNLPVKSNQLTTIKAEPTITGLLALCEQHRERLIVAIPDGINVDMLIRKAVLSIRKNPGLLKCQPASLFEAISEAMVEGLEIGGIRDEAYLVPYGDQAKLMPGYKGFITLVRRTGTISTIQMETVRQGDVFQYEKGDNPSLKHIEAMDDARESRPITHVYVIVKFVDGAIQRSIWTTSRINAHRDAYSDSYRAAERYIADCKRKKVQVDPKRLSAWHTAWQPQAKKTVLRDMVGRGLLPLSASARELINRERYIDEQTRAAPPSASEMFAPETLTIAAPEPVVESEPVVDEPAADITFEDELRQCESLGAVSAVREKWLEIYHDADDADDAGYVADLCDHKETEIRNRRSGIDNDQVSRARETDSAAKG